MPRSPSVPSYRLHKPSGQAVVTIRTLDGARRDVYLGTFNSPESRVEYGRIVAELATTPLAPQPSRVTGPAVSARLTVDQLLLAFLAHAEKHYRRADGTLTDQFDEYKNTAKPLHSLYGPSAAADFGPLALKTVRQAFIDAGNCRTLINNRVGKIKRVFKWAVSEQLVPVTTYTALTTVTGLQAGRTDARESEPIGPVDDAILEATLPHLNRHVRGLIEFQRLTVCRPGEACRMRRSDIDMSEGVWVYRPGQHKTKHKRKSRAIPIGPRAQELLNSFFTSDPDDYVFSPTRAIDEYKAARAANRKFGDQSGRSDPRRVGRKRKRPPAERYNRRAYLTAVNRGCDRAFPPTGELSRRTGESHAKWWARLTIEQRAAVKKWRKEHRWHPNQLRHSLATEVRKRYGLEAAQVVLGHAKADVTQVYAERDLTLALRVAAEMG